MTKGRTLTRHARLDRAFRGSGRKWTTWGLDSRFHGNDGMRRAPFDSLRVNGVASLCVRDGPFSSVHG